MCSKLPELPKPLSVISIFKPKLFHIYRLDFCDQGPNEKFRACEGLIFWKNIQYVGCIGIVRVRKCLEKFNFWISSFFKVFYLRNSKVDFFIQASITKLLFVEGFWLWKFIGFFPCVENLTVRKGRRTATCFDIYSIFQVVVLDNDWFDFLLQGLILKLLVTEELLKLRYFDFVLCNKLFIIVGVCQNATFLIIPSIQTHVFPQL